MIDQKLTEITENIINDSNYQLSGEDAAYIAHFPHDKLQDLFWCANTIRETFKGNSIYTCSILNAKSGACSEDCAFCSQSSHNNCEINTYDLLDKKQMAKQSHFNSENQATQFSIVTSGYELSIEETESIASVYSSLARETGLKLCTSIGMLTPEKAKKLKDSGVSRFHHNIETARSFYSHICSTHDYDIHLEAIRCARQAGLKICSGGIMGMGESWEQRIEMAFTLRELDVDSIPINFLNPVKGTALEHKPLLAPLEALQCIALFRFILPAKDIHIGGGRDVTLRDFQSWMFTAGANGFLIGDYLTTKGRNRDQDIQMINDLGFTINGI